MPAIRVSDGLESCQTVDLLAMKTTIAGNNAPKLRAYSAILITFAIIFAWMPDAAAQTVNLNITKVANPTTAVPGQTVSWTITLQSTTPLNAQYRLTDSFPNGFVFNQAASTIPAGTFSYNSGTNSIIHDGTVPGNGTHQFVFVGTVNPGFNAPGSLNNTATMNYTAPGITLPGKQASASIAVIRTSISGFKYNDQNGNGSFNAGEPRLPGWTIYIDANDNNILDAGELSTVTNSTGDYIFENLLPGTHIVREVIQSGWTQTQPGFGAGFKYTVTLNVNAPTATRNFGNRELPSIKVTKWSDQDNSGTINAPDTRVPNWRFYIDANNNNQLDSGEVDALTDANGDAYFLGMTAGTYRIREVLEPGWSLVLPSVGYVDVTIAANDGQKTAAFLNVLPNRITGIKYHDINGNGSKDPGEPGLQGWRIYVDLNNNGTYDGGEPNDITSGTGEYLINAVPIGNWNLREVLVGGWQATEPSSGFYAVSLPTTGLILNRDFGNAQLVRISGVKYFDRNSNGSYDAGEPLLPDWSIYIDQNFNGTHDPGEPIAVTNSIGYFELTNLLPGTFRLREIMQEGWFHTEPALGYHEFTIQSGNEASGRNFGNLLSDGSDPYKPADIVGNVWYDEGGLRRWDKPIEQPLPAIMVRLVGKADTGETVERYEPTDEKGVYRFENLPFGEFVVSRVESDVHMAEYPRLDDFSPNGHGHRISLINGYIGIPHHEAEQITGDKPNWIDDIEVDGSGSIFMGLYIDLDINNDGTIDERLYASGSIDISWSRASTFNGLDIGYLNMNLLGYHEKFGDYEVKIRRFGRSDGTLVPNGTDPLISSLNMLVQLELVFDDDTWFNPDNQEIEVLGDAFRWMPFGSRLNSPNNMPARPLFNVFGQQQAVIRSAEVQFLYGADFGLNRSRFGHVPNELYPILSAETQSRAIDPFENDGTNPIFSRTTFDSRFKVRNILNPGPPALDANPASPAVRIPLPARSGREITISVDTEGQGFMSAWIDLNNDGAWQTQETVIDRQPIVQDGAQVDAYTFTLPAVTEAGEYWLRMRLGVDADLLTPTGITFGGDVRDMAIQIITSGSSISGVAFTDMNGNNQPDGQDLILDGMTVYADLNGNRELDDNEPRTTTDQDGFYVLNLPGAGTYAIMSAYPDRPGWLYDGNPIPVTIGDDEDLTLNLNAGFVIVSDVEQKPDVPQTVRLHQNYPNPFNPSTNISYDIPAAGHVRLAVYDVTGRLVRVLVDQTQPAGSYIMPFEASSLTSGLYLIRLESAGLVATGKMTLIK